MEMFSNKLCDFRSFYVVMEKIAFIFLKLISNMFNIFIDTDTVTVY